MRSKIIELLLLVVIYYALIFIDLGFTFVQQLFILSIVTIFAVASERFEKKLDNINEKLDNVIKNK